MKVFIEYSSLLGYEGVIRQVTNVLKDSSPSVVRVRHFRL